MTTTITSYDELIALVEQVSAPTPAEQVAAVPARALAAAAPALPPLKMPKLSERILNGRTVTRCIDAGEQAGIVHTPRGVRVVPDLAEVADDPSAVVLAERWELRHLLVADQLEPVDVARFIVDRELDVLDRLAAVA